jgi:glycyl-tRNA synthetase alpha chain
MYLQDKADVFDLEWAKGVSYRTVRHEEEYELSRYSFELADVDLHLRLFEGALGEAKRLLETKGPRVALAAYDWVLRASHAFNVLDARGGISVTQRASLLLQIRKLACGVAAAHVEDRWPSMPAAERGEGPTGEAMSEDSKDGKAKKSRNTEASRG